MPAKEEGEEEETETVRGRLPQKNCEGCKDSCYRKGEKEEWRGGAEWTHPINRARCRIQFSIVTLIERIPIFLGCSDDFFVGTWARRCSGMAGKSFNLEYITSTNS